MFFCTFHGAFAALYEVGPSQALSSVGEVPWETLSAGDTVKIHHRPEPYREKFVLCGEGTAAAPILVSGVPGQAGEMPVIEGRDATTRSRLNFVNQDRGVIKFGEASNPNGCVPAYIIVENLDVKSGRPPFNFTNSGGSSATYRDNAACFYLVEGNHVTLRNNIVRDCANGIFSSHSTQDVVIEGNYIYDNGMESSIFQHNTYTEAQGITYQGNKFGPLRADCPGNNLKDRSAGTVIRYNWIEDGNRQLDLVDANHSGNPAYNTTFVYGNVLVESQGQGNSQIVHYGGDSGDETHYRKGTLFFYHNTVVSTRSGNTTLVRLSSDGESADIRNNLLYASGNLGIVDEAGTAELRHNWLRQGWVASHGGGAVGVHDVEGNREGTDPGFVDMNAQNFRLSDTSPCRSGGTLLADGALPVDREYVERAKTTTRAADAVPDCGGFEFGTVVAGLFQKNSGIAPVIPQSISRPFDILGRVQRPETVGKYFLSMP